MLKAIKTLVSKKQAVQSASQNNALSGKVITTEKVLEQITGARGGGSIILVPVKDKDQQ